MKQLTILCIVVCLFTTGCFSSSSVHPILTDDELQDGFDLNGTWQQVEMQQGQAGFPSFTLAGWDQNRRYDMTLLLSEAEEKSRAARRQKDEPVIPSEYDLMIGKLDQISLLQARRSEKITGGPSFFAGVVTYTFAKFELQDDLLLVYFVDDQQLETLLPKTTLSYFMHEPSDWARNIVITDPTARLQQFIKEHHQKIFATRPLKFRRVVTPTDTSARVPGTEQQSNTATPTEK